MVTAAEACRSARAALAAAGIEDAAFDAAQLVNTVLGRDCRACPDAPLDDAAAQTLAALVRRRAAHEPLQYLCGSWDFLDFTLRVGPGVLIPRADTECVCEAAIAAARAAQPGAAVLDLCSGSGAIAIGAARAVPAADVTAVELSAAALPYLRANTAALAPRVRCVQADVFGFEKALAPRSVDVLVCNPPYIAAAEMETLAPELSFEPRMALVAADNGLAFYRYIAQNYRPALKAGAAVVFEIGSAQGDAVRGILAQNGFADIAVLPDAAGLPRCAKAQNGVY